MRAKMPRVIVCDDQAKNIKRAAAMLLEKWGGEVPVNEEELVMLPGVGPKMALIVLNVGSRCMIHRILEMMTWNNLAMMAIKMMMIWSSL